MEPQELDKNPDIKRLQDWNPQAVVEVIEFRGETTAVVPRNQLRSVCEFLAHDAALGYSFLSDISAVDRFPLEPRFEVNYHLLSIEQRKRFRIKVKLQGSDAVIESVTSVWPCANWLERETFDLMCIRFEGHTDLKRILIPYGFEGHPLLKDFPTEGFR